MKEIRANHPAVPPAALRATQDPGGKKKVQGRRTPVPRPAQSEVSNRRQTALSSFIATPLLPGGGRREDEHCGTA